MNTTTSISTIKIPSLDGQLQMRLSECSSSVKILNENQLPSDTCDKVIEKARQLIQRHNLSKITFDLEPSMIKRVRNLTPDGILRVAEALCAIAGKLGMTQKVLLEKLPAGILAMPSPHDRRIKDETLISRAEVMINSLNDLTKCLNDLKTGIEGELKRLSEKEPFSNFTDALMKYRDFYWVAETEMSRTVEECDCLIKDLEQRSKMDVKGSKEREFPSKNLLDVFCHCYGLKSTETLHAINAFYKRSDEISDYVFKARKAKVMMDTAKSAFRNKYNYFAFLCIKEIYPDEKVNVSGVEKTALEAYNQDPKNYLVNSLNLSKQVK